MKKTVGLVALLLVVILAYSFGTRKATNSSASVTTSRNAEWYEKARTLGTSEFLQNLDEEIAQTKVQVAKTRGLNASIPFVLVTVMLIGFFAKAIEGMLEAKGKQQEPQPIYPTQTPYTKENPMGYFPWEKQQQAAIMANAVDTKEKKKKSNSVLQIGNLWYTVGVFGLGVVVILAIILL